MARKHAQAPPSSSAVDPGWSEFNSSMAKMHAAMASVVPSGKSDVDFVRLMLPHHQAAIDMAKIQLLYGKDPEMRRLAQEIITDQQSEIDLMQLWLKRHEPRNNQRRASPASKEQRYMKIIRWLSIASFLSCAFAQQAPWGRADIPVSSHDRVYAADQTSNTVSVIDPSSNKLLGVIRLGDPVPGALQPAL